MPKKWSEYVKINFAKTPDNNRYFTASKQILNQEVFFSPSAVSDSLRPHELQHTRLPCPSPTPGACSNSSPLSQWCHPTISSSVVPFSCLQSFPASGSFPRSQFFASGSRSVRASASSSALPKNIQDWFPVGWTGLISLIRKKTGQTWGLFVILA